MANVPSLWTLCHSSSDGEIKRRLAASQVHTLLSCLGLIYGFFSAYKNHTAARLDCHLLCPNSSSFRDSDISLRHDMEKLRCAEAANQKQLHSFFFYSLWKQKLLKLHLDLKVVQANVRKADRCDKQHSIMVILMSYWSPEPILSYIVFGKSITLLLCDYSPSCNCEVKGENTAFT